MGNSSYTPPFDQHGELLIMRHPETVYNLGGRFQGQHDFPLSDIGQTQADRAISALSDYRPERIISSPLGRCLAIARPVADELGVPLIIDERVIELDFGIVDGLTLEQVSEQHLSLPWDESEGEWSACGGEALEDFLARTATAAEEYTHLVGRTAVVTHGGAMRGLIVALMGLSTDALWRLEIGNVESCVMGVDGRLQVSLRYYGLTPEEVSRRCGHEASRNH